MATNVIDTIASDLTKLKSNPNYYRNNPKLYTSRGILLESYAKQHKLSIEALQKLVESNSFFRLSKTTIQTGLFSKRDKSVPLIEWETTDVVKEKYLKNPDKILQESTGSAILIQKMIKIITEERSAVPFQPKHKPPKSKYKYPREDRIELYKQYFPDELEKYHREGKHETNLEKKFHKRMPKGAEFYFSDGKVAHNLLTWVQCVHMASNDVIVSHIKNNNFYDWFDAKVKVPELARICLLLSKQLLNEELSEKEIKTELLRNINKTSLNNIIFEELVEPLIRNLKSTDQSKSEDAINKLIQIGDTRVVKPLMDKIFDSRPQIRRKIITGLGKFGDKRATPTLLKVLKHSTDAKDRLLAVKTLGILKDRRALSTLKNIAKINDEVGAEATQVLSSAYNITKD